jgi:membrane protease YdiL (CAAX protease family)
MKISSSPGQSASPSNRLSQVMRQHPLSFFFLLAFGLSWIYGVIILVLLHLPALPWAVPAPLMGPTLSAFFMTALTQGKPGVFRLLRRCVLWQVPLRWYLLALLGIPALLLFNLLVLPGAVAALRIPAPAFALRYLVSYLLIFLAGGPLLEEPGWRGFALPHLQERCGPLQGTLLLGGLWSLWHLPLYLFIPGYNGAGSGLVTISLSFVEFAVVTTGLTFIITWVFNHARGSVLLIMLLHASSNTAISQFPRLFPSRPPTPLSYVALIVVALLIIVVTRGRLGYQPTLPHPLPEQELMPPDKPL